MSCNNLEEIIDRQYEKLHRLDVATILMRGKHNIKNELQKMNDEMLQVSYGIEILRKDLQKMKEQNLRYRELLLLIEALDKKIVREEKNVPLELIQSYKNANNKPHQGVFYPTEFDCTVNSICQLTKQKTPSTAQRNSNIEGIKNCKRTLFNEPEVCPKISFIAVDEFSKIPTYIIGRQSLETINNLISAINQTLVAKYTILSLGKSAAQKKGEINLYLQYKKQELDIPKENGRIHFFTAEDYHKQTKTKLDKTKLNLITALRHCKRLRECRIRNTLLYVIIPH